MIFVVGDIFGQNNLENYGLRTRALLNYSCFSDPNLERLKKINSYTKPKNFYSKKVFTNIIQKKTTLSLFSYSILKPIVVVAPNYYTQNFAFFCKKELQLQKAIKIPFVFRLGSVEICDRLEGKKVK